MSVMPPNDPVPFGDEPVADPRDVEENKVYAVLAYFGLLFLVGLLAAKDSPYARYHVNQGLVLYLAGIVVGAVLAVPLMVLVMIPFVNLSVCCLIPVLALVRVLFLVIGVMNAMQGKMKPLPVIGGFVILK